jgi:uncharacterized membrane protein
MTTSRLEAFSDGVFAIIITIMVIEFHVPESATWEALAQSLPLFLAYILSFIFIAIYWNNHHHLIHTTDHAHGDVLWANIHLLFWLTLIPFGTSWLGRFPGEKIPTLLYALLLLGSAIAYTILTKRILKHDGQDSHIAKALGEKDYKGRASLLFYLIACLLALVFPFVSYALFALVSLMWAIPDKRIEKILGTH